MKISKPDFIPKGATHWQPKSDWHRECFYKKYQHGVKVWVVNKDSDDSLTFNTWISRSDELDIPVIVPVSIVDKL